MICQSLPVAHLTVCLLTELINLKSGFEISLVFCIFCYLVLGPIVLKSLVFCTVYYLTYCVHHDVYLFARSVFCAEKKTSKRRFLTWLQSFVDGFYLFIFIFFCLKMWVGRRVGKNVKYYFPPPLFELSELNRILFQFFFFLFCFCIVCSFFYFILF